jgi:aminopeptidase N
VEHELFHQWFGDYVTCESWSNLTLNESFADLGEILWLEHKYGKDAADEHLYNGLQGYLGNAGNHIIPLVNFHYQAIRDVFNGVTYQKGGRVLNMLRNYLGNDAFYKGLNIYLTSNAFKSAETQQLRLAMEEASGLDLNWFFDQWFETSKTIDYGIDSLWEEGGKTKIRIKKIGMMPMPIDLQITFKDGSSELHYIPMNLMYGTKPEEDTIPRKVYPAWRWTSETYVLVSDHKIVDIAVAEIDPSQRMADVERQNNKIKLTQ